MFQWWDSLQTIQQVFYLLAIPGTIILVLQTILLLFGFGHDSDTDVDHDISDHDVDHDTSHDGADHVAGLRLFTVRGIVAFLAVSGWVGVALIDFGVSSILASVISLIAGFGALVFIAFTLKLSLKMQHSGNVDIHNAVGLTGEVYVPMLKNEKGKVTLVLQERFMELDALCPGQDLKTGQRIRVTEVTENNVLIVSPLS